VLVQHRQVLGVVRASRSSRGTTRGGPYVETPNATEEPRDTAPRDGSRGGGGDGLTDEFEALVGTDPANPDTDADGLGDLYETAQSQTNPLSVDTDADAVPDAVEVAAGSDAGVAPLPEAAVAAGFGGMATRDADRDGLSDQFEIAHGLAIDSADSDSDTLPDSLEVALGSSGVSMDSDADGMTDAYEYELGTLEPLAPPPQPVQPLGGELTGTGTPEHSHGELPGAGGTGPDATADAG
jgi:hypothetical protein